jgi:gliding motility-associated protein GldE
MPDLAYQLATIVLGLMFSGIFSGAEVAFFSIGNTSAVQTDPSLGTVGKMLAKPRRLLATILIGNTFANIVTAVVAAVMTAELLHSFAVPDWVIFTAEIAVITFIILIVSEITPKIIALKNPLIVARRLSIIVYPVFILLTPFSVVIAKLTNWLEDRLPKPNNVISPEDLKTIAEVGQTQGTLKEDEREIIENMVDFGNTTVIEIMTSRVDIIALSTEDTLGEALSLIRKESVSRLPLYEKDLDHILGVVHTKDLLAFLDQDLKSVPSWSTLARPALFIPSTKRLDDLLRDFQAQKNHLAIVVDEYGGTEGIVSLDDVIEEIIGDLGGDDDGPAEVLYTRRKNGDYIFDSKINLEDMSDVLGIGLANDDDEFETLGGLVYHLMERIPEMGEEISYRGVDLHIHKVEKNRVTKVRARITTP